MSNTLSEAYRNDPIHSHHIIPLDFDSLDRVPETHQWLEPTAQDVGTSMVPVIDLTDPGAADLIGHACQSWGMFQVINHGITQELVEKVESEAWRLFALPAREKWRVLRSTSGATGYGSARIAPFFSKCMWHEGFTIMGSCVHDARVLWPHEYQSFCDTMDEYQKKMKSLAHNLLTLIIGSLGVTEEELNCASSLFDSHGAALQLNSYPCCPNPSRAMGLAAHTDSLLLTILHQNGIKGLQILRQGCGWTPVCPVKGALVVNVGDLLHIFSNARFPIVYHRARVNESKHRFSVAYFYGPPIESMVAPISKQQKPQFRALSVKEYISLKAKHFHKALSLVRI